MAAAAEDAEVEQEREHDDDEAAQRFGTPLYLYDESMIAQRCRDVQAMPSAFGMSARFAMKANSSRAILELVAEQGMGVDASSLNEVRRARRAGVPAGRIMLTSQEVPEGQDRRDLEALMAEGLKYNACSLRQLELVAPFARAKGIALAVRVSPGVGSGETVTRNTGDKYSCFGIPLDHLGDAQGIGDGVASELFAAGERFPQHHGRKMFFDRSRSMLRIQKGGIQPDTHTAGHGSDTTSFFTLADNRRRHDVTSIELIDEALALRIHELTALRTDAFCDQGPDQLFRIHSA